MELLLPHHVTSTLDPVSSCLVNKDVQKTSLGCLNQVLTSYNQTLCRDNVWRKKYWPIISKVSFFAKRLKY